VFLGESPPPLDTLRYRCRRESRLVLVAACALVDAGFQVRVREILQLRRVPVHLLVQRRIRLIPSSLPGLTWQSTLEPAPALQLDARIKSGHDKQGCVPFASLH
jgi:hypothetical protein